MNFRHRKRRAHRFNDHQQIESIVGAQFVHQPHQQFSVKHLVELVRRNAWSPQYFFNGRQCRLDSRRRRQPACRNHHDIVKQRLEALYLAGSISAADLRLDSARAIGTTRELLE